MAVKTLGSVVARSAFRLTWQSRTSCRPRCRISTTSKAVQPPAPANKHFHRPCGQVVTTGFRRAVHLQQVPAAGRRHKGHPAGLPFAHPLNLAFHRGLELLLKKFHKEYCGAAYLRGKLRPNALAPDHSHLAKM